MICDWCGHSHDVRAICSQRPASRGVSRRSFIALIGAGVAGVVLAPSSPEAFPFKEFSGMFWSTPERLKQRDQVWFVKSARPHDLIVGDGLSPETAFRSINEAMDHCHAGDTIRILPGHLEGHGYEPITVAKPGLTFIGGKL